MIIISRLLRIFQRHNPVVEDDQERFLDEHYLQAVQDLEQRKKEREKRMEVLLKRRKYYNFFKVRRRYGISLKEFNRRVEAGTWYAWLADDYPTRDR